MPDTPPPYNSCRERSEFDDGCQVLKPVHTRIGKGYACPECQMTYIQVDKGAFIPFDQAMELTKHARAREEQKAKRAQRKAQIKARPPKQKKKKKRKKVRH